MGDSLVALGFNLAQPQQFGRLESGKGRVACDGEEPVTPNAIGDFYALLCRALVIPQKRWTDDLVMGIEEHGPVHLAGQSYGVDLSHGAGGDFGQHLARRKPPVLWVLFGPSRPWTQELIRLRGFSDEIPRFVHGHGSGAGSSNV